jgi:hypothetical protein
MLLDAEYQFIGACNLKFPAILNMIKSYVNSDEFDYVQFLEEHLTTFSIHTLRAICWIYDIQIIGLQKKDLIEEIIDSGFENVVDWLNS